MDAPTSLALLKTLLAGGLALWMTLTAVNNVLDPRTNLRGIAEVMTMRKIKEDPGVGSGLEERAVEEPVVHRGALWAATAIEAAGALLMWRGAVFLAGTLGDASDEAAELGAIAAVNLALAAFLVLWLGFLVLGLWFGYWIKLGVVQRDHLAMLAITLLAAVFVNGARL